MENSFEKTEEIKNLIALVFEKLSQTDSEEQTAMIIQLIPGLTHCETGQIATLQHLVLGISAIEDGTEDFGTQLKQAVAHFKEEVANQAFLPTDEEVQNVWRLRGGAAHGANENIQVQQHWRWKLKDELGLAQSHKTLHGAMGQDIFSNEKEALEKFYGVFESRIYSKIQEWVSETPTRLGECASYFLEKSILKRDYKNLNRLFKVEGELENLVALTKNGAMHLLLHLGLFKYASARAIENHLPKNRTTPR
ncbi:MAG: hypothetical protein ACRC4G_01900 [Alphaproteobacteria bacterium]